MRWNRGSGETRDHWESGGASFPLEIVFLRRKCGEYAGTKRLKCCQELPDAFNPSIRRLAVSWMLLERLSLIAKCC